MGGVEFAERVRLEVFASFLQRTLPDPAAQQPDPAAGTQSHGNQSHAGTVEHVNYYAGPWD